MDLIKTLYPCMKFKQYKENEIGKKETPLSYTHAHAHVYSGGPGSQERCQVPWAGVSGGGGLPNIAAET